MILSEERSYTLRGMKRQKMKKKKKTFLRRPLFARNRKDDISNVISIKN